MASSETVTEILLESGRILKEDGWTQQAMARDANGKICGLNSSEAVSYCLWSSVVRAWRLVDPENEKYYFPFFERRFLEVLRLKFGYPFTVTRWNDEMARSLEDIKSLLDEVIASIPPGFFLVPANQGVSEPAIGRQDCRTFGESGDLEPAFLAPVGSAAC
jgi:hypothetical protein